MGPARSDLPGGTVTFLFTDVEGSTRLLQQLGSHRFADALAEHRRLLREAFARHGGVEVDAEGDALFVAFTSAPDALAAARSGNAALAAGLIRVRMGVHTGTPLVTAEGYVGPDVHRAARIAAAGHGGQVLVSAATAALAGAEEFRDLGMHRLKDLSAPERIYQLGEGDFPPLKSLHRTNLPISGTPFLGREEEMTDLEALIRRHDVRLVTLTGPGGTGKTRLALQAAGAAADAFEDGVWWVPLAPLRDPQLVLAAASRSVGARDDLAGYVSDRSMLLLFDNFEHVIDAAPDVAGVLERCPRLKILATSREPLRLAGEWEYAVDVMREAEAVELFSSRALAARHDFVADVGVREICRRLDNLPLAIELAAARVKVLSTKALLERLEQRLPLLAGTARDAPERQRTLRATIAWSHELLSRDEQALFRRLAVFRGGCTLAAAEAVCDADLDTLASLVDKSLLRQRGDRFPMLETIREFAAERLVESGEDEGFRRRHADHFLALAEEAELPLRADSSEWADRLEHEHDNLRAALDRLVAAGETQLVLRMAGALSRFWYLKSHLVEAQRRLEQALASDTRPTEARAKALNGAALMAFDLADGTLARRRAEEALALHRSLGDEWRAASDSLILANAVALEGDLVEARRLEEEAAQLFETVGDELGSLFARENVAWMTGDLGDAERERVLQEEILRRARAAGYERPAAIALARLAFLAADEGHFADAEAMLKESIRIDHHRGQARMVAVGLGRMAYVLAHAGRMEMATRLLSSSVALIGGLGASGPWPWHVKRNEETTRMIRRGLDEDVFARLWEEGRALSLDEAVGLALEGTA